MFLYFDIVRFAFLRFFSYPYEILAKVIKRIVELLFLIIFWTLVAKASNNSIDLRKIISYILMAMGIGDLVMSRWGPFGADLGKRIKSGDLSIYLVKPVSILPTIYSIVLGRNGMNILLAIFNLLIGIAINPPKSYFSIFLFLLFFANAWIMAYSYNIIEASLYFYFGDATGVRNSFQHIIRVFSGAIIPIYLFPNYLKQLVRLTPFPGMVYGPASALNLTNFSAEVYQDLAIAIFWSFILYFSAKAIWDKSIKKYEAIGI